MIVARAWPLLDHARLAAETTRPEDHAAPSMHVDHRAVGPLDGGTDDTPGGVSHERLGFDPKLERDAQVERGLQQAGDQRVANDESRAARVMQNDLARIGRPASRDARTTASSAAFSGSVDRGAIDHHPAQAHHSCGWGPQPLKILPKPAAVELADFERSATIGGAGELRIVVRRERPHRVLHLCVILEKRQRFRATGEERLDELGSVAVADDVLQIPPGVVP